MMVVFFAVLLTLGGCASTDQSGNEDFNRYVEFCRETAMTPVDTEDPNDPMSKVDWMVGASATTQEFNKEYKIVYADREYLSFYAKECFCFGGAHKALYDGAVKAYYAAGPVEVVIDPKSL